MKPVARRASEELHDFGFFQESGRWRQPFEGVGLGFIHKAPEIERDIVKGSMFHRELFFHEFLVFLRLEPQAREAKGFPHVVHPGFDIAAKDGILVFPVLELLLGIGGKYLPEGLEDALTVRKGLSGGRA